MSHLPFNLNYSYQRITKTNIFISYRKLRNYEGRLSYLIEGARITKRPPSTVL